MPRTKDKPKWAPRRIGSEEERNKGRGGFVTLKKTGDYFLGYALFTPKPDAEDNPGYFEYFEHYTPATGYVACAGDDCPVCDEGDNPSTRAKTLWLVVDDDLDSDSGEVKTFNLNYYMITDMADFLAEDEPVLGQLFRIKRQEGQGKYLIRPKKEKLTKTQLKAALKDAPDLEKIVRSRMLAIFEEMGFADAMEEDEEDEPEEDKPKARRGRPKGSKNRPKETEEETSDDEFDPDEEDEIEDRDVIIISVKKTDNTAKVNLNGAEFKIFGTDEVDLTEFAKGEIITVSAAKDEDGDFVVTSAEASQGVEPEDDEIPGDDEIPDSVDDETVEVVSVNSSDDTLTVKMEDDTEFELFFLDSGEDADGNDWSEFDLDDYSEGQKIVVSAEKDDDGDLVASVFPKAAGKGKAGKKKASKK